MLRKIQNKSLGQMCIILLTILSFAHAQPHKPPQMPTFTQSKVTQMLNSIDKGYNFTLLRVGYFGGHIRSPFPAAKGFEVLTSTLKEQLKGSAKWFLLESLRGFAGFHSPNIPMDEGFEAYGLIFDNAKLATTADAQEAVRSTIRGFVSTIPAITDRKDWDTRFAGLLLKAWQTWHAIPLSELAKKRPLDWGQAIEEAGAQSQFLPIVNKLLEDAKVTPDFQTLKLAVIVFENRDEARAIQLLQKAQTRLPPEDYRNQKWLYDTWIKLITGTEPQGQWKTTITDAKTLQALAAMRRQQISYTGTGYADLLELYWELNDQDKAAGLIKTAQLLSIPQKAIAAIGTKLLQLPRYLKFSKDKTQRLQKQGIALLQKYLTSSQTLQPDSEISARLSLGRYYVKQDLITEALKVLSISHIKKPPPYTEAALRYNDLLRLKAVLDKKLQGVTGVR